MSGIFGDGHEITIICNHTEISERHIKAITWYKDNKIIDAARLKIIIDNKSEILFINKSDHRLHNGEYFCQIELSTGQNIRSMSGSLNLSKLLSIHSLLLLAQLLVHTF